MSNVKIWIHLIFSTKHRQPFLSKNIRYEIFKHITENCKLKGISLRAINGYTDHVHCLISLGKDQNIADVTQLIKGESSFWINKNKLTQSKFEWQDEYFAVAVSESMLEKVRNYIRNQEDNHKKKTFNQEYDEFIQKFEFHKSIDLTH